MWWLNTLSKAFLKSKSTRSVCNPEFRLLAKSSKVVTSLVSHARVTSAEAMLLIIEIKYYVPASAQKY